MDKAGSGKEPDWQSPLRDLELGIAKLRELAANEADPDKRAAIEMRIADIEERRDDCVRVLGRLHG